MNWIQRYKLRNYLRSSTWMLSVFGMFAGLVSVNCIEWIERYDLVELNAPSRFYPTNRHAAQAFRQSPESTTAQPDSSAMDKRDEGVT